MFSPLDTVCVVLDADGATVVDVITNMNKSTMIPIRMVPHDVDQQINEDGICFFIYKPNPWIISITRIGFWP